MIASLGPAASSGKLTPSSFHCSARQTVPCRSCASPSTPSFAFLYSSCACPATETGLAFVSSGQQSLLQATPGTCLPHLALQQPTPASHPPASFFGLEGVLHGLSQSPLRTPSFTLSIRSFRDRLAAASCAQIAALPDLQLQSLTRT